MALIGSSSSLGGIAGSNAVARLLVVISGESSGLSSAVAQSEGTLSGFSKNASSIGKNLTRSLTLPLLAIGGLAIKAATDFETSFAKVVSISTILDKRFNDLGLTTDSLKQKLFDMAKDPLITVGPTELANALYFAGSAGLKASQALDVVKASAEGASVGLGTTEDISKVLIFALTNFADQGLTTASAMDTLTAAIQEGTAAPDELAIALGRLLPVAREAGVSFQETVASVAALSNLGVPTRVATTSLRALFSELLAPTEAATARLNEFGITADDLRNALSSGGLIEAMQLLNHSVHGNEDALHDIIPQIRGFTAFVGLNQNQMKRYRSVLGSVTNAQGKFGKVLEAISQTPQFKFDVALKDLKLASIQLGETLLPVFTQLTGVLDDVGQILAGMPTQVKAVFAAFIVLGAAVGPTLQLYGALTSVSEGALKAGSVGAKLVPTFKAVSTAVATIGIASAVAIGGFESIAHGSSSLISIASTLVGSFVALQLAIKGLQVIANLLPITTQLTAAFVSLGTLGIGAIAAGLALIATAVALYIGRANHAAQQTKIFTDALGEGAKSATSLADTLDNITVDPGVKANLEALAKGLGVLNEPTGKALQTIITQGRSVDGTLNNLNQSLGQIPNGFDDAKNAVAGAITKFQQLRSIGVSTKDAMEQAGIGTQDFRDNLDTLQYSVRNLGTGPGSMSDLITGVENSVSAFNDAVTANKAYQESQYASILATAADSKATATLADKMGVSVDFLKAHLDDAGVSAVGLRGKALDTFKTVEFGAGKAAAASQEMADAITKAATEVADSLAQAFTPFSKVPKLKAPGIDEMISKIQKLGDIAATESANIVALQKRGVPTSLIEQAISAGPGFVSHLAGSTDAQLKKFVAIYERNLGLVDEAILEENAHQEVKGKNMVQGFTIAMLSQTRLPQAAALAIVNKVTNAFASGNLSKAGIKQVQQFAQGIAHVKGVSQTEAVKAVNIFADGLINGNLITKSGKIMAVKAAEGIHQGTNLTLAQATKLVQSVTGGVDNEKTRQKAKDAGENLVHHGVVKGLTLGSKDTDKIGQGVAQDYARGIRAGIPVAVAAATLLGTKTKEALDKASHNSPEYFTYYMGRKLVDDMGRGIQDAARHLPTFRPKITVDPKQAIKKTKLHIGDLTSVDSKQALKKSKLKLDASASVKEIQSLHRKIKVDAGGFVARREHDHHRPNDRRKIQVNLSRRRAMDELGHEEDFSGW